LAQPAPAQTRVDLPAVRALPLVAVLACACGTEKLENRPTSDATVDSTPTVSSAVYAVSFFRLGFTKRDGESTTDAWKSYGFDLDGKCTSTADSETSKDTCKRLPMSEADVLTDGDNCIDNNFGSKLIPMIRALDPAAETKIGDGIKGGGLTLVLRIDDLSSIGPDPSANAVLYAAKARSNAAVLDGSDVWDVDTTSVTGGDINKPLASLTGAVTIVDGKRVWSGRSELLQLPAVFISGATDAIPVRGARVDINLDDNTGTIAGYADMTGVKAVVSKVLQQNKLCPGTMLFDAVMTNIGRTADMPAQLPHDTAAECTSLSMGLGIELSGGTMGTVVPTGKPRPNPCVMDGGVDADATMDVADVLDAADTTVEDVSDASDVVDAD
jgi:hypothetical protein